MNLRPVDPAATFPLLVGDSAAIAALRAEMRRVLHSNVAVCVRGESGTGKELVARSIHASGSRSRGPFVAINCAAIPESLQESELFGHERGAFTGASQMHRGRFEQAEGGTLFLDEVGDMAPATQVRLLRTLQERTICRVGGIAEIATNVRIVCATHRNLEEEVASWRFREDLYFRLMVYPIDVPPLRERIEDVPALVGHFLRLLRDDVGRDVNRVAPDAIDAMLRASWRGNIRQLQNVVHRAMLSCQGDEIALGDLPAAFRPAEAADALAAPPSSRRSKLPVLDLRELERIAIEQALDATTMHIGRAASLLGIGRSTLYRRLVDLGLMQRGAEKAA